LKEAPAQGAVQISLGNILRRDANFRWFLVVRMLAQVATMAPAFYMVYIVDHFGASKTVAGVLTSVAMITQIVANPLMGWFGDRWSHYLAMGFGLSAAIIGASVAWLAPSVGWFYLVVIFSGIANVSIWTIAMAMTLQFGQFVERQAYIGLSNTLIAPITILAPVFGGWLADQAGYTSTFLASAVCGVVTLAVFLLRLRDPRKRAETQPLVNAGDAVSSPG
jgi:MFS family permease